MNGITDLTKESPETAPFISLYEDPDSNSDDAVIEINDYIFQRF